MYANYDQNNNNMHPSTRPSQITSKSRITNHTKYPGNESYDQVVMFKSDGFDNSQLNAGNAQKRYYPSSGPNQGDQPTGNEEFNTSRFSGIPATAARPSNIHNENSSSALVDEEPYSGKQDVTNPFTQTTP